MNVLEVIRNNREYHGLPRDHITLYEAKQSLGGKVIYRPNGGGKSELGVVRSVNDSYVFVQFLGESMAKATRPDDLEWFFSLAPDFGQSIS